MRKVFTILAALLATGVLASPAVAAVNVKSVPTATFSGASVTLTGGNFSGLGNTEAFANLTVTGVATYTCTNPQGHASPGQNPVAANPGASGPVGLGNSDHNGRGTISNITASVTAPPTPSAETVGCGGSGAARQDKWTVTLNTLTATAAHLVITQGGSVIFCRDYTLGGPATGTAC
jgi:hypothetical protein